MEVERTKMKKSEVTELPKIPHDGNASDGSHKDEEGKNPNEKKPKVKCYRKITVYRLEEVETHFGTSNKLLSIRNMFAVFSR